MEFTHEFSDAQKVEFADWFLDTVGVEVDWTNHDVNVNTMVTDYITIDELHKVNEKLAEMLVHNPD